MRTSARASASASGASLSRVRERSERSERMSARASAASAANARERQRALRALRAQRAIAARERSEPAEYRGGCHGARTQRRGRWPHWRRCRRRLSRQVASRERRQCGRRKIAAARAAVGVSGSSGLVGIAHAAAQRLSAAPTQREHRARCDDGRPRLSELLKNHTRRGSMIRQQYNRKRRSGGEAERHSREPAQDSDILSVRSSAIAARTSCSVTTLKRLNLTGKRRCMLSSSRAFAPRRQDAAMRWYHAPLP